MWPLTFEERLQDWRDLRDQCLLVDYEIALHLINDWWWRAPIVNHYLHWDDGESWPDPWDLLADNHFCDLAKSLGIVYTILMLNHDETHSLELVQTPDSNLVQVNKGKYILNWAPRELLNNQSTQITIRKTLDCQRFKNLIR
jgi:hypothetical protein